MDIITLNIKADEPTVNNRVYSKDVLIKALADKKEIFVENEINANHDVDLSKVIGSVQLKIQDDNTVSGPFTKIDTPAWNKFENIPIEDLDFTIKGVGEFEKDNKTIIKDIKLISIGAFIKNDN